MRDVSVVRWARDERRLSSDEVDGAFEAARSRLQVFAFQTRRLHVAPHTGSFSLKRVLHGREMYRIDGQEVALEPGALLLVNAGERYESRIDGVDTAAWSCFLPDDVARALPEIVPLPFRPSPRLADACRQLSDACAPGVAIDPAGLAAEVDELTTAAVAECLGRYRPDALPDVAARRTRRDLLARAGRARDCIEDRHGCGVTLNRLADVACLSKYHLLRIFAEAFGATPAAYARRCRLQHAARLLVRGVDPRRVARAVGYDSVSTLNRALRRQDFGSSSDTGGASSRLRRTSV